MDDRTMAGFAQLQQLELAKTRYHCDVIEDPSRQPEHHAKFMERYNELKSRFIEATTAAPKETPNDRQDRP